VCEQTRTSTQLSEFWVFSLSTRQQGTFTGPSSCQINHNDMCCTHQSGYRCRGGLSTLGSSVVLSSMLSLRSPALPCYSKPCLLRGGLIVVSAPKGRGCMVQSIGGAEAISISEQLEIVRWWLAAWGCARVIWSSVGSNRRRPCVVHD